MDLARGDPPFARVGQSFVPLLVTRGRPTTPLIVVTPCMMVNSRVAGCENGCRP